MDSKTIFISSVAYLPKVTWAKQNDNEWIYVGVNQDFNEEKVSQMIHSTFNADEIYIVSNRHNSQQCILADAINVLRAGLEEQHYLLWVLIWSSSLVVLE
jgi:hypothetical protein